MMPPILHYLWVVAVHAMQAGRSDTDPLSNTHLVDYCGRSFQGLQVLFKDVPEAFKDPHGVALHSILFLMGPFPENTVALKNTVVIAT